MATVYGIQIAPHNDRYVQIADKAVGMLEDKIFSGEMLVNIIPTCKSVSLASDNLFSFEYSETYTIMVSGSRVQALCE